MSLVQLEHVDQAAVLRTLNLNPADPHTQAVLLICQKYGLDPLLKHVVLIQGRPYITRDGYLHHAHASGQFDGIEVLAEGEDAECWWAKAAVHRKDMTRPFVYRGRYPKRNAGNPKYGPEMAVKTAEVMALRRAFDVSGLPAADEAWEPPDPSVPTLSAAAAKSRLLTIAGGDVEAARTAWERAGLEGRDKVSEVDLGDAERELHELSWSWAQPADDDGDDPEPVAELPGPESAADADARAAADDRARLVKAFGRRSTEVFRADYDAAPKGDKTRTLTRLRHALVYAVTGGAKVSANELTSRELSAARARLEDVGAGRLGYEVQPGDDGGVTWGAGDDRVTVMWAEVESVGATDGDAGDDAEPAT